MKDKILEQLKNELQPIDIMNLNDKLHLTTAEELKVLQDTLLELENDLLVYKTKKEKYILFENCPYIKMGRLSMSKKDYGFVILPKEDDIYINKENLNGATDDDIVVAEIISKGYKKEGRIIKVVKRQLDNLVGELISVKDKLVLKLDNEKSRLQIELDESSLENCVEGHKVLVKIYDQKTSYKYKGRVVRILGHVNDPGVDILSIAYKYGINDIFPDEVINELTTIASTVNEEDKKDRTDLTNEVIFTIDGDDTKDIDDAISIKKDGSNYVLGVHIADVSYYVKRHSSIDDEAFNRGTSSYLADTVIPMLPHQLSNGICSLNPNVERLTLSCVMTINNKGKVINYEIFPSVIKSRIQMTYKKVNDILERNIVAEEYVPYENDLRLMKELADILRKEKVGRGYIDFDLDEAKIVQDENGNAVDVVKRIRESGELLIEDFMIVANETVATHIYNMNLPFVYRIHEIPSEDKIEDFLNLIKILGYKVKSHIDATNPKSLQNILDELEGSDEFTILSSLLLRSMKKAEYSVTNNGHFGLASKCYTHFTSPIRRYPDLTVHRCLRDYLFDADLSYESIRRKEIDLVNIALQSSEREVAAVKAERDVMDMKTAEYMEGHIGEVYNGFINSLTTYGFYVELPNLIEGLVHIRTLKGDFYNYIPELLCLIGKSTKKQYRLGDKVTVKCVAASSKAGTIDFELVDEKNGNQE